MTKETAPAAIGRKAPISKRDLVGVEVFSSFREAQNGIMKTLTKQHEDIVKATPQTQTPRPGGIGSAVMPRGNRP